MFPDLQLSPWVDAMWSSFKRQPCISDKKFLSMSFCWCQYVQGFMSLFQDLCFFNVYLRLGWIITVEKLWNLTSWLPFVNLNLVIVLLTLINTKIWTSKYHTKKLSDQQTRLSEFRNFDNWITGGPELGANFYINVS